MNQIDLFNEHNTPFNLITEEEQDGARVQAELDARRAREEAAELRQDDSGLTSPGVLVTCTSQIEKGVLE